MNTFKNEFDLMEILKSIKQSNTNRKKSLEFVSNNKGATEIVYKTIMNKN